MPVKVGKLFILLLLPVWLTACATLKPDFEDPSVEVISIKLKNTNSLSPDFDIALRVTNPNRDDLSIDGMTYSLFLGQKKVVSGVANDLPRIPAYGEAVVNLQASLDLFGSLSLLNDLMNQYQESVDYELVAKLDLGRLYPTMTITRQGLFRF